MPQPTYLYVIHFDVPLAHATHYTGITRNVQRRMEQHAANHGARIITALEENGIGWHLAAAYEIGPDCTPRDTEKLAKGTKRAARYCPECGPSTYPKNCRPVQITPFHHKPKEKTKCPSTQPTKLVQLALPETDLS